MEPRAESLPNMADEKDKCQRWRKITIDQLGYLLNLTLTFAIATLGYCFALLKDKDFAPGHSAKQTMILAMSALAISAIVGFVCALIRLLDFRGTARRACDHPKKPTKEAMRDLDNAVWILFYVQLGAFAVGATALGITLTLTYGCKLA
jgi:hypothetical protein